MQYDIDQLRSQFGSWYVGIVIYNLFEGDKNGKLERSLFSLRDMIKRNITHRTNVHRSKKNRPADGAIYGTLTLTRTWSQSRVEDFAFGNERKSKV